MGAKFALFEQKNAFFMKTFCLAHMRYLQRLEPDLLKAEQVYFKLFYPQLFFCAKTIGLKKLATFFFC